MSRAAAVRGALARLGPRRAAPALAAIAALALGAGLVCARGEDGPADAAARLVPASALVYLHLSTDPERDADARLARLAGSLPAVGRLRDRIVAAVSPQGFDLERDVRPWLGDELAYAAVSPTDSVVLAAVADRPKAEALVARVGNLSGAERYRGVRLLVAGPTALAFVGGFLAVGTEAAVRAAVDLEQGDGARLADLPAYRRASEGRPPERSLDAYASAAGVREVLAPRDGLPGALGALLDRPGLTAAGASVSAEERGLRAHVRLAGGAPRDAAFEPVLLERVPEGAAAYAGVRGALRLARVLGRLGAERPLEQLGALAEEAGIELDRDLLAPLSGELAIAVTGASQDRAGSGGGAPVVTLKARTADARRTEAALARLQEPIARRLAVPGTIPAWQAESIGGLQAFTLRVTPELGPSYAVAEDGIVISTAPAGLEPPRGTLAAVRGFEATIGDVPARADSLVFLDLRQLLAIGEQTGLTAIPGLATARDDLGRVRAAGAVITEDPAHPSDTTAELFLEIP
ncbi:MAG TPA: DUF3352 domain-containing protein [Solirubrobacteraceae bacterium]|nr:DUF3352 domain-containing protein [Solirubrobacteraceae bacterium]